MRTRIHCSLLVVSLLGVSRAALAQPAPEVTPTMKVDAPKALVDAPKAAVDAPKAVDKPKADGVTATAGAGALIGTGNSQTKAFTGSGQMDYRFGLNSVGATLVGNYADGRKATDADPDTHLSTANIQGRIRYDRYITERFGAFLMYTHRYDQIQGYDARINVDPGVKYLVLFEEKYQLGIEAGYDLQYDVLRNQSRYITDDKGNKTFDGNGNPFLLDKTKTDHAARLAAAYKHSFNKEVTLQSNLEYIQSFTDSARWRMNFNALLAAKLFSGFSVGAGFTALYDHAPLPSKKELDTTTTIQLIYAFSNVAEAPVAKTCPCPEEVAPSAPAAGTAPAAAALPPAPPPPATIPPPPPATEPAPAPAAPPAAPSTVPEPAPRQGL